MNSINNNDDMQLRALEAESADMLALLKEQRDDENARLNVRERVFADDIQRVEKLSSRTPKRLSPWWAAAALVIGIACGYALPHSSRTTPADSSYTLVADTLHGRSLATGDVNTALLVSL